MLFVDNRVGSKELAAHLPDGSYTLTTLDSGDVSFLGYGPEGPMTYPVGIERKAYYDLFECFRDGRLNSQIQRMTLCYKKIYLIIEGRPRVHKASKRILVPRRKDGQTEWVESKITYDSIDNYLNTLSDELHIQVKRSYDLQESGWQIWNAYTHCSAESHSSHLKLDTTWETNPFMPASFEKRVAVQLDRIGDQKADAVIQTFRSVYDMALATEEKWMEVPGIGKKLAKDIVRQMRRP